MSKFFEFPPFAGLWLLLGSWAVHCQCDTSLESHSRQVESRYRDLGSLGWNTLVRTCVLYDLTLGRVDAKGGFTAVRPHAGNVSVSMSCNDHGE